MVEVMKIIASSFIRSGSHSITLSGPDPAAGHRRPTPSPETPGHSQASLGQSLVWLLLLSPQSCIVLEINMMIAVIEMLYFSI